MKLKIIDEIFTVCKIQDINQVDLKMDYCFVGKTDEEISLVCPQRNVPRDTDGQEDGWRAFRIEGVLDFSLIGILSKISALLAENQIGIFVVSTFNTDYILVKEEKFEKAMAVLKTAGYDIA